MVRSFVGFGESTIRITREDRKHLVMDRIQCRSAPFIPASAKPGWNWCVLAGDLMHGHVGRLEDELRDGGHGSRLSSCGVET